MNIGKVFEDEIKKSIPDTHFKYRFKDGTGAWGGSDKTRFQSHNICDYQVMWNKYLFLLELKTHKGKSIPFNCLREKQIKEMESASKYLNVKPYFIFNFRDLELTYAIKATDIAFYIRTSDKKSFSLLWCFSHGVEIKSEKLRTRYTYDMESFFDYIERSE